MKTLVSVLVSVPSTERDQAVHRRSLVLGCEMCIPHHHLKRPVPEQLCHRAQIDSGHYKSTGKSMTIAMLLIIGDLRVFERRLKPTAGQDRVGAAHLCCCRSRLGRISRAQRSVEVILGGSQETDRPGNSFLDHYSNDTRAWLECRKPCNPRADGVRSLCTNKSRAGCINGPRR